MVEAFNTVMSLLLAALTSTAILSSRIRDGVIIKAGLICAALGFMSSAMVSLEQAGPSAQAATQSLVNIGLLIIAAGYLWRIRQANDKGFLRRVSDWTRSNNRLEPK